MDRRYVLIVAAISILAFMLVFWWPSGKSDPSGMQSPAMLEGKPISKDVYFKDCTEVRKAGRAPLMAGQPGYRRELDADGTGMACPPLE